MKSRSRGRAKMLMAQLRHCRPKGVKWALHAHNTMKPVKRLPRRSSEMKSLLKKKTRAAFIARAQCSPGGAAARTKMFIAPLGHCRPKGVKWALHAHNEAREEGTVLHARSEKNENKRLFFFPPLPAGTPPKKGWNKSAWFLSCARAVMKRRMGCCASYFPPLPAGTKALFSVLHARSGENKNKRLCLSPLLPAGA
jgi:hypothetical protein